MHSTNPLLVISLGNVDVSSVLYILRYQWNLPCFGRKLLSKKLTLFSPKLAESQVCSSKGRAAVLFNEALAHIAQRDGGCPVHGDTQGQAGCGSEQPGLGFGDPAHSRGVETGWALLSFSTQAILWFYDSMIWLDPAKGKLWLST